MGPSVVTVTLNSSQPKRLHVKLIGLFLQASVTCSTLILLSLLVFISCPIILESRTPRASPPHISQHALSASLVPFGAEYCLKLRGGYLPEDLNLAAFALFLIHQLMCYEFCCPSFLIKSYYGD